MTIEVVRDTSRKMKHTVHVRQHTFAVDEPDANGGEDLGVTPHEVYDSALGACKALTVLWYANRKQIPVEDIRVTVDRDDSQEREGLLAVAEKCPVHKLMTQAKTEVTTELAPAA